MTTLTKSSLVRPDRTVLTVCSATPHLKSCVLNNYVHPACTNLDYIRDFFKAVVPNGATKGLRVYKLTVYVHNCCILDL